MKYIAWLLLLSVLSQPAYPYNAYTHLHDTELVETGTRDNRENVSAYHPKTFSVSEAKVYLRGTADRLTQNALRTFAPELSELSRCESPEYSLTTLSAEELKKYHAFKTYLLKHVTISGSALTQGYIGCYRLGYNLNTLFGRIAFSKSAGEPTHKWVNEAFETLNDTISSDIIARNISAYNTVVRHRSWFKDRATRILYKRIVSHIVTRELPEYDAAKLTERCVCLIKALVHSSVWQTLSHKRKDEGIRVIAAAYSIRKEKETNTASPSYEALVRETFTRAEQQAR